MVVRVRSAWLPADVIRRPLAHPGILLFIGLSIANGSNYLFQVVMSRLLGPADYSLLGSVFALITVLGVSFSALQTASAKAVATNPGTYPPQRFDPLSVAAARYGVGGSLVVAALSPLIASFLRTGVGPALAVSTFLVPAALLAIGQGRLQGAEAFAALAVLSVGLAASRIILSPIALVLHLGVTGVVMVSVVSTFAAGIWALQVTRHSAPSQVASVRRDTVRASLALLVFWVMVSVDVPIARHFLATPALAGQYAAASVVGKAVLWLPGALSLMMFPRVASRRTRGIVPHPPLVKAFVIASTLCAGAVAFLFVAGARVIPLFFGPTYSDAAGIAWEVGAACLPFALANVLIFYHLTRETNAFIAALAALLVMEVGALARFHDTATEIVTVMGISGLGVLMALGVPGTVRRIRKHRASALAE